METSLAPDLADNQQGFSIIDILIAMAMLAAAAMQLGSIRNNARGNTVTPARMLAKARMEVLKNTPETDDSVDGDEFNIDADTQPGGFYNRSDPSGRLNS